MTRTLSISDTGLRLIKAFEGFRPVDRELVTGVRVVGYGHRLDSDDPVHMSRRGAEEQLLQDLELIEEMVNDEVHAPLSQGQYDALCSLAFNIGPEAFRASDIVRAMNNGRVLDAANGFDVWRKATISGKTYVVDALMRRRTAEKSLFLRNEPAVPAPSALLIPEADPFAPLGPTDDGLPEFTDTTAIGIVPDVAIDADDDWVEDEVSVAPETNLLTLPKINTPTQVEEDEFESVDADELDAMASNDLDDDGFAEAYDDEDEDDDDLEDFDESDLDESDLDEAGIDDAEDDFEDFESEDDDLDGDANLNLAVNDDLAVLGQDPGQDPGQDLGDEPKVDDTEAPVDADDGDDDDIYQLRAVDAVDVPELEENLQSPIAAAADSLGDRLSALLDSDEEAERDEAVDLPVSLLQPTDMEDVDADSTSRSNLVSFPKREIVMEEAVVEDTIDVAETVLDDVAEEPDQKVLVIDNLEADDVMRSSRDPENPVFDPDGDPVENAMRYLERQADEKVTRKSGGGLWVPLALGGLLVGASAVMIGRGATQVLDAWGPTAATASAITGGVLVLFTIYAAARGRFA